MRKFLLQLKVPIFLSPRSHSQDTVKRFWFNPTAWHRDVMTSRHDATKLIFPISACRCARKMILFFVSMKLWVAEFENVVSFVFAWWRHIMTSCHDVKNWLYSISACRSAREMILFWLYSFPARLVWKCYRFCVCMMSWRHDVTSWRHKTHFSYISLSMF